MGKNMPPPQKKMENLFQKEFIKERSIIPFNTICKNSGYATMRQLVIYWKYGEKKSLINTVINMK